MPKCYLEHQRRDRVTKRAIYQRAGIPTYVIAEAETLVLLELSDGGYVETSAGPSVDLASPYPVRLQRS